MKLMTSTLTPHHVPAGCRNVALAVVLALSFAGLFLLAPEARAEATGPVWKILSVSSPTNFKPGDTSGADTLIVTATNVGGASTGCTEEQITAEETAGPNRSPAPVPIFSPFRQCSATSPVVAPVTITDVLPENLRAVETFADNAYHDPAGEAFGSSLTEQVVGGLACTTSATAPSCSTSEPVAPGDTLVLTIRVHVETRQEGASEVNQASVTGGGAAAATVSSPVSISTAPVAYGIAHGGFFAASSTHQAGGHPNVTTAFFLNTTNAQGEREGEACGQQPAECTLKSEPVALSKDVRFDLPAGVVGSTVGFARCSTAEVTNEANCPRNSMVGTATLIANRLNQRFVLTVPVYNVAPAAGEPAAFAFNAFFFPVRLDTSVVPNTHGEYAVRATVPGITGGASSYMASVTIWGDPAEHNGPGPDAAAKNLLAFEFLGGLTPKPQITFGGPGIEEFQEQLYHVKTVYDQRVPLLTLPSQCSTPLTATLETDSWEAPGAYVSESTPVGTATECAGLTFSPSFSMLPDTLQAGAPAGYTLNLSVPQDNEPEQRGTPNVRRAVATLPAGTVISPSAANGLGSCSPEQFSVGSTALASCPANSKIGTVRVKTPDIEEPLTGEVFLGAPECDPCTPQDAAEGRMVKLFVQIEDEGEQAVRVKLAGTGQINQRTGQITASFNEDPQFPFSSFKLSLTGGEHAALSNPRTCGTATTTMDVTPWSAPFTTEAELESSFDVDEGCFGAQFNPTFVAGTTRNQAGSFSPLTLTFGRSDSDEYLGGLQVTAPPGVSAILTGVPLCAEAQANEGTCEAASQIGTTTAQVGPGGDPYTINGGRVYLTGPYGNAPYGASIVLPATAGPYTLAGTTGKGTVVVRAAVSVNALTGQFTVTTDPLPTELDGIPLQLRLSTTTLGANNAFTYNPTSCEKLAFTGTLTSVGNKTAAVGSSFQDTNCADLKFKPSFTATTDGATSRNGGASLDVKIATKQGPATPEGEQESDIRKVDVQLPINLPSRLSTLQKACTEQQFAKNPAECPEASFVGTAVAHTPVLPVALEGPAILVSHAGAEFPDLDIVLHGNGVVIRLVGNTDIIKDPKTGTEVTYSKFETAPDAPISSFELKLPEGPHSILGGYIPSGSTSFCSLAKTVTTTVKVHGKTRKVKKTVAATLAMPTTITAQDGAVLKQDTKIAVTGCSKAKAASKKNAKKASRARRPSTNRGGGS